MSSRILQTRDASIEHGQFEVVRDYVGRIGPARRAQVSGGGLLNVGRCLVSVYGMFRVEIENRPGIVDGHAPVVAFHAFRNAGQEKYIDSHRLHQHVVGNQMKGRPLIAGARRGQHEVTFALREQGMLGPVV